MRMWRERPTRKPRLRTHALVLTVLLLAVACGQPGTGSKQSSASVPQLSSRPLGSSFVAVIGSGFPVGSAALVTGTTPRGSSMVNVTTDSGGGINTSVAVPDGYQGPLTVRAAAGSAVVTTTVDAGATSADPAADAGVRPLGTTKCTATGDVRSPPDAAPGDVVCLTGDSSERLTIAEGGSDGAPITYSGGGRSTVKGIDVTADNVVVEGFTSTDAQSMGARLQGNNITFQDNTVIHPVYAGDDTDGLRFFGDGIKIVHNTIGDVYDGSNCDAQGCGDGPHPDCLQTFYSDTYPTSSNITIEGNRCANVAAQCLIGEGPVLPGDGVNGPGQSADWIFYDNYCDDGAAQAVMLKDVKNATIVGNDFQGSNNKAIALADASTGAHVGDNKLDRRIGKLITFDDGAESPGYIDPKPDQ